MNLLLGILLILLYNFVSVQLQGNIFTFSPSESVCIGETVTLTCYVYPPVGDGFTPFALLSFNGSGPRSVAFINNPTNGLTEIGYSATVDILVIPVMGASARIQLTISSYQVSDRNTIFGGYGVLTSNASNFFVIQSPGPSIAGPPTAVSMNVSLTSLIRATCSGVVRVAWTPGTTDRPILSYSLSLNGDTLGTFSPSVTSNDSTLSVATDMVYRYSVTASSCAGSSTPSYGVNISVQSYSLVNSPLYLSYDVSTSMLAVDWGLVPGNEPLLLGYALQLNYSHSQYGTTNQFANSTYFSLISGTSLYSVPLTPHSFSTADGVVTNVTACIAIASQCGTAFSGNMLCGSYNSENPPTTTQSTTTPTINEITSTTAIVTTDATQITQTIQPTQSSLPIIILAGTIVGGVAVLLILVLILLIIPLCIYFCKKSKDKSPSIPIQPHTYEYIDINEITPPIKPDPTYYTPMSNLTAKQPNSTYANLK